MKLKILFTVTKDIKEFECESFDFDNGFLKINKPIIPDEDPSEIYIPNFRIDMIMNFGKPKDKKEDARILRCDGN